MDPFSAENKRIDFHPDTGQHIPAFIACKTYTVSHS